MKKNGIVSIQQLNNMLIIHKKELRIIEKMNDLKFQSFKSNFMVGKLDPDITRNEAIFILKEMIATNLNMQNKIKKGLLWGKYLYFFGL